MSACGGSRRWSFKPLHNLPLPYYDRASNLPSFMFRETKGWLEGSMSTLGHGERSMCVLSCNDRSCLMAWFVWAGAPAPPTDQWSAGRGVLLEALTWKRTLTDRIIHSQVSGQKEAMAQDDNWGIRGRPQSAAHYTAHFPRHRLTGPRLIQGWSNSVHMSAYVDGQPIMKS